MIDEVYLVIEDYLSLQLIHLGHELLKYWRWDKGVLKLSLDKKIRREFIDKFAPIFSEKRSREDFSLITIRNYRVALEDAIDEKRFKAYLN